MPAPTSREATRIADPARHAAFGFLTSQASKFPMLAIGGLESGYLSARDGAFAHAVADAAVRRWLTLQHLLSLFLRQPFEGLEPPLRGVLLGARQLLLLDKVPVHAAIDTAVQWAKTTIRPGAGAMVNAVLRRVAELRAADAAPLARWSGERDALPREDGTALQLTREVFPADPLTLLSIATSNPPRLLKRWIERYGEEQARGVAMHGLCDPPVILDAAHAADRFVLEAAGARPHSLTGAHVAPPERDALTALLSRSDVWVQDPAAAKAVSLAASLEPRVVLDLCAGRGTKTRQLAAVFPGATIFASDPDPERTRDLALLARANPRVRVVQPAELSGSDGRRADLVVADVPCSNTGVLPRRAEARYRCDEAQLARLTLLQREIVALAARLVKPGGHLLYSTCSLEREENEDQAAALAQPRIAGVRFEVVQELRTLPAGLPGDDATHYHDGGYAALLRAVG